MSLDFLLRTAEFADLSRAVASPERPISVRGVIEPAKACLLACLAKTAGRPIVFVRAESAPLGQAEQDARFYLPRLAPGAGLAALAPLSENPYFEVPPALDVVSSRMKLFRRLLGTPPALIVTSLGGLLKPVPAPDDLRSLFLDLEVGGEADHDALLQTLARYGYTREDLIASPGEYAWRGGIVDVFSPWEANPFRIELDGTRVASLREFDISTQRSVKRIERLTIPGLREFPAAPEFIEAWKAAARRRGKGLGRDLEAKTAAVDGGEFGPSFAALALLVADRFVPVTDYLRDPVFVVDNPEAVDCEWDDHVKGLRDQFADLLADGVLAVDPDAIFPPRLLQRVRREAVRLEEMGAPARRKSISFPFQPVPRFDNKIPFFLQYIKKLQEESDLCSIYLLNAGTRQRLAALLRENDIPAVESDSPFATPPRNEVSLLLGPLPGGFSYPREKLDLFAEKDIFTEEKVIVSRATRRPFFSQFQDLQAGDYVVHADYGIGVFRGLRRVEVEGQGREFIELHYRDGDQLLVPVEDLNLVQKFSQAGADRPPLDKLGTNTWEKTRTRAKRAVEAVAKELVDLYAKRRAVKGHAFSSGGPWDEEFAKTFEYDETEDQLRSIREIRGDMERETSMDRLICGDVGYGKTEVAMRAAFKAVMDGKQVAVLCPTTVLASQHMKTFRDRMVLFPVRIEALTRLQSPREQKAVLEECRKGFVDILIGTHRLLSRDVGFKDLGLLIVDEEQRFGVGHKERIKQLKATIDVLTMTATPIPRTLNMSLSGLRDISLIETPPRDRLAVHTVVTPFNAKLVAAAIRQEIARGGQVYVIHNRVEDIDKVEAMIVKLVPQARVVSVHGRMTGPALEKRMLDFVDRKYDVLVSTTIIENGIDIPLVNTLIVDRADLYGLAQLYQLRGRVGRSARQAYAYFLVPPYLELTPIARERLKALKEFSELGSGFRLAARDLEIRGAGNLLGHRQHGTLESVGFEYYMQLLDQAIRGLKGEIVEETNPEINLKVDIHVPEDYLPQVNLRLNLYKRLAAVESLEEIERIRDEIADRFGPVPGPIENLLRYGALKHLAAKLRIRSLDRTERRVVVKFRPETPVDWSRVTPLLKRHSGSLSPEGVMSLALRGTTEKELLEETVGVLMALSS
ncbi:MAG TPA: transcription-repair coupling factor [Candidatus Aminicenantes bacterium]|nr:transcription-repair coupling factor [Candidatus Aminicenantes bacterium]HRY66151.1 transcription-repair coupling factor [Candidatus Aminicenantes bacterium]HRZ73065.1 transcription-repair coupling factor [Candidatus Aminicenantes bacterium]